MNHRKVRADALRQGDYVVEQRREDGVMVTKYLMVDHVSRSRFVHYDLEDGSERVLSPDVFVEVAETEEAR